MKTKYLIIVSILFFIAGIMFSEALAQGIENDTTKHPEYWRHKLTKFSSGYDDYYQTSENTGLKFGVYTNMQLNNHAANFTQLSPEYQSCCPENYGTNSSIGYEPGLFFELPLSGMFVLKLSLGYQNFGVKLKKTETFPYSYDNERKEGRIEHYLNTDLSSIIFRPGLVINPTGSLFITAGPEAGLLISKSFDQNEELMISDPLIFDNDSDIRNELSGDIPDANSISAGAYVAAGYNIPLNRTGTFNLLPEISYSYYFTNIAKNLDWKYNTFKFGISLRYSPEPTIDTIPDALKRQRRMEDSLAIIAGLFDAKRDSTMQALALLKKDIDANVVIADISRINFIDPAGFEEPVERLRIEESKHSISVPLLNYIFFEKGSSNIQARYKQILPADRYSFNEESLIDMETIDIYHQILNIIGKRMDNNPDATITLTGCNDNTGIEEGDTLLSYRRAERVSYYLQNVWKTPVSRIKIKAGNLPEKYTNSIDPSGIEENRRVEIYSDNIEILKPVTAEEAVFSYVIPQKLRTHLNIRAGSGINDWYMKLEDYYGMEHKIYMEQFDTIPKEVTWDFGKNRNIIPRDSGEIYFTLYAEDTKGKSIVDLETVPVDFIDIDEKREKGIKDTINEVYSILLPFEDPGLDKYARKTASKIKNSIEINGHKNPEIYVTGYTDILGTKETNIELAKQRAEKLVNYLDMKNINSSYEYSSFRFDNSLPEGRFYNRSVEVKIKYLSDL